LSGDYKLLKIYKFPASETEIPIEKLFVYPLRGIKGIEVEDLFMTPDGPKYDREWTCIRKSDTQKDRKFRYLTNTPEFTRLR
jgi:uncharacterized protein YcbX